MPALARFFGISIYIFYDDHNPPHFHALYGEYDIEIAIKGRAVTAGQFPPRPLGLVIEWASQHEKELLSAWEKAQNQEKPDKIEPLR